MCIEIYHPEIPITIPYENEELVFDTATSYTAKFTFLVQNCGNEPIDSLYVLYPRGLHGTPNVNRKKKRFTVPWRWTKPQDLTYGLGPGTNEYFQMPSGNLLELAQPDPNFPQFTIAPMCGLWLPNSTSIGHHAKSKPDDYSVLNHAGFSCWYIRLLQKGGLLPLQSQWFHWEVVVKDTGDTWGKSPVGKNIVVHQVRSPVDVRRTMLEFVEGTILEAELTNDPRLKATGQRLKRYLHLHNERRVDIRYYELSVWPGKPSDRFVVNWAMERDIRLRGGSPRIEDDPRHPLKDWAVFEFKSGSSLQPDHSWKDEGFVLHFTLACP